MSTVWKAETKQELFDTMIEGIAKQGTLGLHRRATYSSTLYPRYHHADSGRCCVIGFVLQDEVRRTIGESTEYVDALIEKGMVPAVAPGLKKFLLDMQWAHDSAESSLDFRDQAGRVAARHGLDGSKLQLLDSAWCEAADAALAQAYPIKVGIINLNPIKS